MTIEEYTLAGLDPVVYLDQAGFAADEWQEKVLRGRKKKVICNTSRQVGKSTTIAGLASHTLQYKRDAMVIVTAPTRRQSNELFIKIKRFFERFPSKLPLVKANAGEIETSLGGRCICVPGEPENIAGFSAVDLLIIDEAAYAPDKLYSITAPMVAVSGGTTCLISTPFIRSGFFYKIWEQGGDDWLKIEVKATDCPRIPAAFLEEQRKELGDWWFNSQYMCQFQDAQGQVFKSEWIKEAMIDEEPLFTGTESPMGEQLFGEEFYASILNRG